MYSFFKKIKFKKKSLADLFVFYSCVHFVPIVETSEELQRWKNTWNGDAKSMTNFGFFEIHCSDVTLLFDFTCKFTLHGHICQTFVVLLNICIRVFCHKPCLRNTHVSDHNHERRRDQKNVIFTFAYVQDNSKQVCNLLSTGSSKQAFMEVSFKPSSLAKPTLFSICILFFCSGWRNKLCVKTS